MSIKTPRTEHRKLRNKEIDGIIDHADKSVLPKKLKLSIQPSEPIDGDIWYDKEKKCIKVYID